MALCGDSVGKAYQAIAAWRSHRRPAVACPMCGQVGLNIIDRSARPHAEWYALSCSACGLDETLHVPLSAPVDPLD